MEIIYFMAFSPSLLVHALRRRNLHEPKNTDQKTNETNRKYSEILENTRKYSEILGITSLGPANGNTRNYSEILGSTPEYFRFWFWFVWVFLIF